MSAYWMLLPIVLPILCGAIIPLFRFQKASARKLYVGSVTLLNTIAVFCHVCNPSGGVFHAFEHGR